MENLKIYTPTLYEITWTGMDGHFYEESPTDDIYKYAEMLEEHGGHSITIYYKGEEIDRYVQGRSTRNFSSF